MALYGAYSPKKIYYPQTIKEIVEYAQVRGIRVVPEIGGPARAGNGWQWGEREGKGELAVCLNKEPWREFCNEPPCGQLNPLNNETYIVSGYFYRERRLRRNLHMQVHVPIQNFLTYANLT